MLWFYRETNNWRFASTFVGETPRHLAFVMKILPALTHLIDASWGLERALYRLRTFVLNFFGRQTLRAIGVQYCFSCASACFVVSADTTFNVWALLIFCARFSVSCKRNYTQRKSNSIIDYIKRHKIALQGARTKVKMILRITKI